MLTSIVVPNHGRDLNLLKRGLPKDVEFIEIDIGKERSEQRNIGIAQAKGEIIIWLDSDQTIQEDGIRETEELINMGYTCVYFPEIIVAKSFFGKVRNFERSFYTGTYIDVPRGVLKKNCPKFDSRLNGPEDADWGQRVKGLRAVSNYPIYHYDDISFWDYCKKKAYYTKSMKKYAELWPNDPCLNIHYRCWTVFTENGKWRKLIRHPILTLCVIGLLFLRGIIYAFR